MRRSTHQKPSRAQRLPAAALCERKGWGVGTVLVSSRWKHPRPIRDLDAVTVALALCEDDPGIQIVRSFPEDVAEAGDG